MPLTPGRARICVPLANRAPAAMSTCESAWQDAARRACRRHQAPRRPAPQPRRPQAIPAAPLVERLLPHVAPSAHRVQCRLMPCGLQIDSSMPRAARSSESTVTTCEQSEQACVSLVGADASSIPATTGEAGTRANEQLDKLACHVRGGRAALIAGATRRAGGRHRAGGEVRWMSVVADRT